MMKTAFFVFFMMLYSSSAVCNSYVWRTFIRLPMFPSEVDILDSEVQSHCCDIFGFQVEGSKVYSKRRLQLSIGIDQEKRKYHLVEKLTYDDHVREFSSTYLAGFIRASRYHKLRKLLFGEYGIRLGYGLFTLREDTGGKVTQSGVPSVALDGKIFRVLVFDKKIFEVLFGFGIQKNFVSAMKLNGATFHDSDFGVGANFFLGVGYRH